MARTSQDMFYVGIRDKTELRRQVLESLKESINILKSYEKFKIIKEQKTKKIHELNEMMKEINRLNAKIKRELPRFELDNPRKVQKISVKENKIKTKPFVPDKKSVSHPELQKLEYELNKIEEKLGKLK